MAKDLLSLSSKPASSKVSGTSKNDGEELKSGFTTGSCITATAMAALNRLLEGREQNLVKLIVPRGDELNLSVFEISVSEHSALYGINKYSGDDPDVTNGALIISKVTLVDEKGYFKALEREKSVALNHRMALIGGYGVGLVTKPGLAAAIGEPAINPTPRSMVLNAMEEGCQHFSYEGYLVVEVIIPKGRELAKKTFNGNLGIVQGISVLGTSGIVAPMSEQALIDTIEVEMKVCKATGHDTLVITPGNYGKDYLRDNSKISEDMTVKCSNFIGDALHFAGEMGFERIVLSGHLGKLVKVAGGVLNTHSKYGDGRMEILINFAKDLGLGEDVTSQIGQAVMVDEAIRIISQENKRTELMELIVNSIEEVMVREVKKVAHNLEFQVATIVFSNKYGLLGESKSIKSWFG